jgi:hypothetical protein
MASEIIVGIMSLFGTLAGSVAAILVSNKLTVYRIDRLEEKVGKHNNLIERTYRLEEKEHLLTEKIKVANHRIEELESYHKPKEV